MAFEGSVDAGEHTLGGCFFIAGSDIDLTCKIKALNGLGFKCVVDLSREDIIIFDGVGRTHDLGISEIRPIRCQIAIRF